MISGPWRLWTGLRQAHILTVIPCVATAWLVLALSAPSYAGLPLKPSRALVIADARARDGHVYRETGELGDAIALMTLWGIPHDVLRLDTQVLREENLLDAAGQPVYGVILWAARMDLLPRRFQEGEILRDACLKHHISLIAFGGRIDVPAVQEVLGLRVLGSREYAQPLTAGDAHHFLVRDKLPLPHPADEPWCAGGPAVEPSSPETKVVIRAGDLPLVTARTLDPGSGTHAVWLGGDADCLLRGKGQGLGICLFQRALVWSLGAVMVHEYDNTLLLRMDDPGTAQSSYLRGYQHSSLSQPLIRQKILAPLREHHARLSVFCCPGYIDDQSHSILHTELVDRTDVFGNPQNNHAMFAALLEGQRQDLIEIGSHGWTHMAPDLDTPIPGSTNWWTGTVSTEWADYRWYREFYDQRRNRDVPADVQLQHMRTSCDWLESYFGSRPLSFCPPGHAVSGNSFLYPREMAGAMEVQLEGVEPKATYQLFVGEGNDWSLVGELHADATGTINTTFEAPDDLWLEGRGYFTINKPGGRSQYIAGPVGDAPGFDFAFAVRDRNRMSPAEREVFTAAGQTLRQGRIAGHLNPETYRPALRSPTCTYQAAGRMGFGLMLDTACHYLNGEQVRTLRMVPVLSWPQDIDARMSRRAGMPTVFRFHDSDLDDDPDYLVKILKMMSQRNQPVTYLSPDELAGYAHARWTVHAAPDNSVVAVADFSSPMCRYLYEHESTWTLLATDEVLAALRGTAHRIMVREDSRTAPMSYYTSSQTGPIPVRVSPGKGVRTFALHGE